VRRYCCCSFCCVCLCISFGLLKIKKLCARFCYTLCDVYILINSNSGSLAANKVKIKHAKAAQFWVLFSFKQFISGVCVRDGVHACVCVNRTNARDSYLYSVGQKESRVVHWTAAAADDDCDAAATQLLPGKTATATATTTATTTATWTKVSKMIKKEKKKTKEKTKNTKNYEIRALLQFCHCFVFRVGPSFNSHLSMRFRLSVLRSHSHCWVCHRVGVKSFLLLLLSRPRTLLL